jgi:phage tail sheath protein FI
MTWTDTDLYAINTLINGGHADPTVQNAMDELARGRGDSVALLDVPSAQQQFQAAINYRKLTLNLNSSYSALFTPDVLESDNINGKQQFVPFSGWAAALCARTDRVANPSYAIAGLNRGLVNVLRLRQNYNPGQMDALFDAQLNYVRAFVGQGTALWEQRTLQAKSSALSWLSVRRIVNVIKVALYDFGLYVIHEPLDEITQRQVTGSFSDYLQTLKNARALHDFTVISDSSNNTPAENNQGILRVTVIIIPVIPVSKLVVDLVVSKQGVSFQETVSQLYAGS